MKYETGIDRVQQYSSPSSLELRVRRVETLLASPSNGNSNGSHKRLIDMAYGGNRGPVNPVDIEVRFQRLERGHKFVRRGIVVPTLPQFKSQNYISQTSGNNPFVTHTINGVSFPAGRVPDQIAPTTNNSLIKYPRASDL